MAWSTKKFSAPFLVFLVFMFCNIVSAQNLKFEFAPVNKAELEMKDNPKQPGAHAMILEWRDSKTDNTGYHQVYFRMKIFTAEGKKYGDIEVEYKKDRESVNHINARTIHQDGTIIPFSGQVFDKLIVKDRNNKYHAKTFSMPDIQPGSIVEYYYTVNYEFHFSAAIWFIQRDLYIQKASFRLTQADTSRYYGSISTRCNSQLAPHDEKPFLKGGQFGLDVTEVPAYEEESFAPPQGANSAWFICWYTDLNTADDTDKFWKAYGKERNSKYEERIGRHRTVEEEANSLIAAADTPEQKIRKLYDRSQKIRNLGFEHIKTEQEVKKEKLKELRNIEDVLKNGYAYGTDINLLFVGLARAAGFEANMVQTSTRNKFFFNKESHMDFFLDDNITVVKIDGKNIFLDPGTAYCPYGFLSWFDTGVVALKINKDGGDWVTTPLIEAKDAQRIRKADLQYSDGILKGKVHVEYKNNRALSWRLDFVNEDEAEQKHDLEEEAKTWFPQGADVKLVNVANAMDANKPLLVEYDVEINGMGSSVGSRVLVPMAIFQSNELSPLRHEKRKFPVYFHHASSNIDRVNITIPSDLAVDSIPPRRTDQQNIGVYDAQYSREGNVLQFQRTMALFGIYYPLDYYSSLRSFFDKAALSDQDSAVLKVKQ